MKREFKITADGEILRGVDGAYRHWGTIADTEFDLLPHTSADLFAAAQVDLDAAVGPWGYVIVEAKRPRWEKDQRVSALKRIVLRTPTRDRTISDTARRVIDSLRRAGGYRDRASMARSLRISTADLDGVLEELFTRDKIIVKAPSGNPLWAENGRYPKLAIVHLAPPTKED